MRGGKRTYTFDAGSCGVKNRRQRKSRIWPSNGKDGIEAGRMKFSSPRIVEQCDVLCGATLLHLRILFDGEQHQYDLHRIDLATWRLLCRSAPGVELNLEKAKQLVEEQAHITCDVSQLKFKWHEPRSVPAPGRAW
jgi:hypothetical protein